MFCRRSLAHQQLYPPAFTFVPGDIGAPLVGFFDAEDNSKLTKTGSRVTAFADSIASSSLSEVSSSGPTVATSAVTGRQVLQFNGSSTYLQQATVNAAYPLTGAMEIWAVVVQQTPAESSSDTRLLAFGSAVANWIAIGRRQNTKPYNQAYVETANTRLLASPNGPTFDGACVVRAVWDGTTQSVGLDGGGPNGAPVAVTQSGNNTRWRLGASAGTSAASFWQGEVSAILLISGNLSVSQVANLEIWSRMRMGI